MENNQTREKLLVEIERLKKELKKKKKYGLIWEDKPEDVVEMCKEKLPVLKEVKSKEVITDKNKPINLLIEGDNYHALSVLNYTHKGKIDVIYIDPPYNTGNKDFKYNDRWIDREDAYRHSKWLSFMSKRLRLAKSLLKNDGMFFCSIDDNEMSQLKFLLDEIFGENNFINCISVKTKSSAGASGGGEDKKLKKNIEYLLFYAKNRDFFFYNQVYIKVNLMELIADKKDDGKQFEYRQILVHEGDKKLYKTILDGSGQDIKIFHHNKYTISSVVKIIREEGISEEEVYFKYFEKTFRATNAQTSIRTRVAQATTGNAGLFSIEYKPRSGKNRGMIARSYYLGAKTDLLVWLADVAEKGKNKIYKREKAGTLWADLSWNGLASEGGVKFENGKKPIAFLKRIIQFCPQQNATILDFFAGSASTGHALLDLNKIDNQERTFILCTNNENKICDEKTYPRLNNVIKGWNRNDGLGGNLKYFKTDFVDYDEPTDRNKIKLTEKATEMLCVKEGTFELVRDGEDFKIFKNSNHYTSIIWDQVAIPAFKKAIKDIKGKFSIYVFSLGDETFDDEFKDIKQKVQLSSIPEAILRVYRRIFK